MATNEGLKIRIGATIDQLQKDLKTLKADFAGLGKEVDKEGKSAAAAGKQFEQLGKSVSGLSGKQLPELKNSASNTGAKMAALNNIVRDAPYGINGVANNFTQLADAMFGASVAAQAVTFGISVLVTGAVTLSQKYGSLGAAISVLTGQTTALELAQKKFNEESYKAIGNVQGELSLLQSYLSVARDENISRDQRLAALREVQKEYPDYLGNINLENVNSTAAAASIDKLTRSLVRKAKIQGAQNIISEEYTKLLKAENTELFDQLTTWDKVASLMTSFGPADLQKQLLERARLNQVNGIIDATKSMQRFQQIINDLQKEEALDKVIGFGSKGGGGGAKNVTTISDVLKELQKDLTGLDVAFVGTGGKIEDLATDKIKRLERAFKDLSVLGVRPGSDVFNLIKNQVEALQNSLTRTPVTMKIPVKIDLLPQAGFNHDAFRKMVDGFFPKDEFEKSVKSFQELVKGMIKELKVNLVAGLAEGIGAIASGASSFNNVLGNILNTVGEFLIGLGKAALPIGILAKAVKQSFNSPQGAIIAGIGAIAVGGLIKGFATKLNKGVPSFATGGGVFGAPTMAMIGDNPGREEYVIPSEVLDKLGGRGSYPSEIVLRAYGTDLVGVLKLGNLQTGRING